MRAPLKDKKERESRVKSMNKGRWIWYPGDFEIYHGLLQNLSREERGVNWPAFWRIDDCRKNVKFHKVYTLEHDTVFTVHSEKTGYILIQGKKLPFEKPVSLQRGEYRIEVYCGTTAGLPAIFIEGECIYSDETWQVEDYVSTAVGAGTSPYYLRKEQNPEVWEYDERICLPSSEEAVEGGVLYDFGEELNGIIKLTFHGEFRPVKLSYGESETEAKDVERCYYSQMINALDEKIPRRAFRYMFIPGVKKGEIGLTAVHQYVDITSIGTFRCENERLNRIWKIAETTFKLCSGVFFIDGIKRDKWIWSGDAYQSYFINQYLMFDEDINKRTILALRGNDPVDQHINTIVDYSMYWVISIYNHYMATADNDFVTMVYPKVKTMMQFLEQQLDQQGFIVGKEGDWTFIDWADIDKEGAVCAEQMLLAECWKSMIKLSDLAGEDSSIYKEHYKNLTVNINKYFWKPEFGAYIDSFASGNNKVTRHANIFALLFEIADEKQTASILKNVILNEKVDKITTPYFKFYELEALCIAEKYDEVKQIILDYWGSMADQGAATFWEEYDPSQPMESQYGMYDDPYGKSLCHAWAGSPIYLIGRYYMGVRPLKPGYEEFEVAPQCTSFEELECTVPVKGGTVVIQYEKNQLKVTADREGGILRFEGKEVKLLKGETTVLPVLK